VRPRSRLHLDRRVLFAAVSLAVLTGVKSGHGQLEHRYDSKWEC
jgi:hypothetical protein